MQYKCLIVDDELHARKLISIHLSKLSNFEVVGECETAIEVSEYLKTHKIDLLFLDIEMPVLKGNDFVRTLVTPPKIVFTTAYRDYAVQAFDLDVFDYLVKPITFERFYKTIQKFLNMETKQAIVTTEKAVTKNYILVSFEKKKVKLRFEDIEYIESLKDYLNIHILKSGLITTKQSLVSFLEELPSNFIRIHRSFVINTSFIFSFNKSFIQINEKELPIGDTYKTKVLEYLDKL